MAIDIASDVASILGPTTTDFPQVTGTLTEEPGGASDTITGIRIERTTDVDGDLGLDEERAFLIFEATDIANTTPSPGNKFTVAGERDWTVVTVQRRQHHYTLSLARRVQRGTD